MNLGIAPHDKKLLNNNIFNPHSNYNRDNIFEQYITLKNDLGLKGIKVNTIDMNKNERVDIILAYNLPANVKIILQNIRKNPLIGIIYVQTEPEMICRLHNSTILASLPFDLVLTWNDNSIKKYGHFKKLNIIHPTIDASKIPYVEFKNKKFCCMIAGNKMVRYKNELYSERLNAIRFFSGVKEGFDLFGVGWETSNDHAVAKTYRGKIANKTETMCRYKFSICYENVKDEPGLITEKIFDSFAAGVVPIYYGASNIAEYVPRECYINFSDFNSYDDLLNYMQSINNKKYNSYLEAAKTYINGPKYKKFTSEEYVKCLLEQIQELRGFPRKRTMLSVKIQMIKAIFKNLPFLINNQKQTRRFIFESLFT